MVLVDADVILDVLTGDPLYADPSSRAMHALVSEGLAINPLIYAELAVGFSTLEKLEAALAGSGLTRLPLPFAAGFRAAEAFVEYRKRGGTRRSPLPDFYIGAHAEIEGIALLTRDTTRYKTYFPQVRIFSPTIVGK